MTYKEYGATIAPANRSLTGFPIVMGSHIGGGRTVNGIGNLYLWQILGDGANITEQENNALGQIWYDRSSSIYYKLNSWTLHAPNWIEFTPTPATHNHNGLYLGVTSTATDSDKLDGQHGSYYLDWTNITNKPDPSITLTGDVTGSGTMTDLNNVSFVTTVGDDSHSHTNTTISGLDGTKITTGTISYLRLPMGTSTNTVAYGNHLHTDIYQPHDTDLDAIAGLVGPGLLRRELNNTWNLDTTTYTSNVGTVTSVVAGAGLNFTTFSNSGSIVLGTPSTITSTTTNSVSGTTHAHALTLAKVDIVALGIPGSNTTYTFATGTTNGTFNVTPSGGSLTPISICGLGTAAYTSSGNYATSAHTHGNITSVGAIGTTSDLMVKTSTSGVLTTLASGSSGQFLQYNGTWATPPNVTTSVNGFMSTTDKIKLDGLLSSASATLPATIGWYRIATSAVDIARCSARFEIDWTVSGIHGQVTLNAGIMYGSDPTLNMIQYVHYGTGGLSQARIVYHTTYAGNYAYLEVYNSGANALVVNVQMLSSLGWTLITPSTVGSIPSGYTSQTLTFYDGIVTEGQLVSSISTGTAPLVVNSTTLVSNLNTDYLDSQHGAYYLDWNNFTNKPTIPSAYALPLAANGTKGGVQIGFTATGANLPLLLSGEKGYIGLTNAATIAGLGYTPYNSTNPNGYTTNTGTVTSIGMSVPTGLSVTPATITSSGTFAISLTSGYSIPTTANQTNWNSAYSWGNHANANYLLKSGGIVKGDIDPDPDIDGAYCLGGGSLTSKWWKGVSAFDMYAHTFHGDLDGNSTTASTLLNSKTLTVGNTGKSFNGSANVSWSLSEIGAEGVMVANSNSNTDTYTHAKVDNEVRILSTELTSLYIGSSTSSLHENILIFTVGATFSFSYHGSYHRVGLLPAWVSQRSYIICIWNGLIFIGEVN